MKWMQMRDPVVLLVIAIIKIAAGFSSPGVKRFLFESFAFASYHLSRNKRKSTERNLSEIYHRETGDDDMERMTRRVFLEFWEEKFWLLPSRAEREAIGKMEIEGIGRLEAALQRGRGVILWESNSFGKRALSKQILHQRGFAVHQIHSENHSEGFLNPYSCGTWMQRRLIKNILEGFERRFVAGIINLPESDSLAFTRTLLERLRRNAILCVSGDAQAGQKHVPVKFMGRTGAFPTGMVSLARVSGAPLLPMFCVSEGDGKKRLIIEQPISIGKTMMDREQELEYGISRFLAVLETYIRRYPEQYKKWHMLDREDLFLSGHSNRSGD